MPSDNHYTVQKMKFSIKDFFIKYDQIRSKLRIWSHLLKKSLMENFIFCAVIAKSIRWQYRKWSWQNLSRIFILDWMIWEIIKCCRGINFY